MNVTHKIVWVSLAMCAQTAQMASANVWQICEMQVKVTEVLKVERQLRAEVLQVKSKLGVECPQKGEMIQFTPETADYQSELARRHWPKVGQKVRMRYQYLDGICKGDGNDYPCTIKHYPMMSK